MRAKLFFVTALLCGLAASSLTAQNIKKKYSSMSNAEGAVFFIHPQGGFTSKAATKDLEYDITYLTSKDSATYNFTIQTVDPAAVDSVKFASGEVSQTVSAKVLYIEPQKKEWISRISLQTEYKFLQEIYKNNDPYQITLYAKGQSFVFEMKPKEWKKQAEIINKIFQIIALNN